MCPFAEWPNCDAGNHARGAVAVALARVKNGERSSRPQNACLGPRKDPGRQIKPRRGRARVAVTLLLRKRNDKISRFNLSIVGGESHSCKRPRPRGRASGVSHHHDPHARVPFWPRHNRNRTIAFGISLRGRKGLSQLGRKVSHEE